MRKTIKKVNSSKGRKIRPGNSFRQEVANKIKQRFKTAASQTSEQDEPHPKSGKSV